MSGQFTPDVPSGTFVPDPVPTWDEVISSIPGQAKAQVQQAIGGLTRAVGDAYSRVAGDERLSKIGAGVAESGSINLELDRPKNMTFPQEAVSTAGTSIMTAAPALMLGPTAGVAALGVVTGGQTYDEARTAGLPGSRAAAHAVFEGAVESFTEFLPARALFAHHKNLLAKAVAVLSREYPGELIATVLQDASAKVGYRPDMTAKEFFDDILLTLGATTVGAPVMAGGAHAINRMAGRRPSVTPSNDPTLKADPVYPSTGVQVQETVIGQDTTVLPEEFVGPPLGPNWVTPKSPMTNGILLTPEINARLNYERLQARRDSGQPITGADEMWMKWYEQGKITERPIVQGQSLSPVEEATQTLQAASQSANIQPQGIINVEGPVAAEESGIIVPDEGYGRKLSTRFRNQALRGAQVKSTGEQSLPTNEGEESKQQVLNEGESGAKPPVAEVQGGTIQNSPRETELGDTIDRVDIDTVHVTVGSDGQLRWQATINAPRTGQLELFNGFKEEGLALVVGKEEAARLVNAARANGAESLHNTSIPVNMISPGKLDIVRKIHMIRDALARYGRAISGMLLEKLSVPNVTSTFNSTIALYTKQSADSDTFADKSNWISNSHQMGKGKVELINDTGVATDMDKKMKLLLQRWVSKYTPDARVVLVRGDPPFGGKNSAGSMIAHLSGTYYIYVRNAGKLSEQYITLAHEFGHVLITDQFYKAQPHEQDALFEQYHEFLNGVQSGMSGTDFMSQRYGPDAFSSALASKGGMDESKTASHYIYRTDSMSQQGYTLSFDEYYADQFVKYARSEGEFDVVPEVKSLLDRAVAVVKSFFNDYVQRFAPGMQFKTWVKGLAGEAVTPTAQRDTKEQNKLLARLRREGIDKDTIEAMKDDFGMLDPKDVENLLAGQKLTMKAPDDLDFTDIDNYWAGGLASMPGQVAKLAVNSGQPIVAESLTRYNWFVGKMASLLQITKMNSHVPGMQQFTDGMRRMSATKAEWTSAANERIKAWEKLGKEQSDKLSRLLLDEARGGKFIGTVVQSSTNTREQTYMLEEADAKARGLNDDAVRLYSELHGDYLRALNTMELRAVEELWRVYSPEDYYNYVRSGGTPDGLLFLAPTHPFLAQHVANTNQSFSKLREQPYLPFTRFGRNAVLVKALDSMRYEGKDYKKGETVYFSAFETTSERNEDLARLRKDMEFLPATVAGVYIKDEEYNMRGMPPELANALKVRLQLSEQQTNDLNDILTSMTSTQSFLRHLQKRKGTAGYSEDVMRVYSDYFLRFANHMSRLTHGHELDKALDEVSKSAQEIVNAGGVSDKRDQLHEWLFNLRDYVMKPKNELEDVRGALTVAYLMFNVKSAMVNGFQVPFVTVPYLSKDYTWAKAFSATQKAYKDVLTSWSQPTHLTMQEWEAMQRGLREGFLDESFASALANTAEGGNLLRALPTGRIGKGWEWVKTKGMVMFQRMEEVNRRVTFMAAYRLGIEAGNSSETSFANARSAIEDTQNEYSKWNRPEFMRGPLKSLMFMFMQYQQNMIFQMYGGDKSWARLMGMHMALAGLMGLPFAGNLRDLVKWFGKLFDKNWDLEADARSFLADVGMNPDWMMNGISHNFFGVDLSGSLSMGRPIPGTEALSNEGRFAERMLNASQDIGGAGIGFALNVMQAVADDNPDTFMRVQRAMPVFLQNAAKGIGEWEQGGKTDRTGAVTAEVTPGEAVLHGVFGFNPAKAAAESREYHAKKQLAQFWLDRRTVLMSQYYYATEQARDREAAADVRSRIRDFNSDSPDRNLIISQKDLQRSVDARLREKKNRAAGLPFGERTRGLSTQVEDLYQTDQ